MKRHTVLASLVALGLSVFCFAAEAPTPEFQGWMKSIAGASGKARKDVAAKANSDVESDAKQLEGIYKEVGSYFKKMKVEDAEKIAMNGEKASKELASAAKDGDDAKMQSAMMTIGGTCGSCHMAHREKVGDAYQIK